MGEKNSELSWRSRHYPCAARVAAFLDEKPDLDLQRRSYSEKLIEP